MSSPEQQHTLPEKSFIISQVNYEGNCGFGTQHLVN